MKVELKNVSKKINEKIIINNINMVFEQGKIYGIYGESKSGKTILLELMSGLIYPTAGEILYNNELLKDNNCNIGIDIGEQIFYSDLTGFENLKEISNNEKQINEIFNLLELNDIKDVKFKDYKNDSKQKLGIATALIDDPNIIFFDESFSNLSEEYKIKIKEYLNTIKKNKIIVISSSSLNNLNNCCDEILLLKDGIIKKYND